MARGLIRLAEYFDQNKLQTHSICFEELAIEPLSHSKDGAFLDFDLDSRLTSSCFCLLRWYFPPCVERVSGSRLVYAVRMADSHSAELGSTPRSGVAS